MDVGGRQLIGRAECTEKTNAVNVHQITGTLAEAGHYTAQFVAAAESRLNISVTGRTMRLSEP